MPRPEGVKAGPEGTKAGPEPAMVGPEEAPREPGGATREPGGRLRRLAAAVRGWGTTAGERGARLPCDDLITDGQVVDRAVDVEAPPEAVFRWLCQLRVAPYSYDWIDNWGRTSPRQLTPGLEELETGQRFMTIFRLTSFEPDEHVTMRSRHVAVTYRVAARAGGARSRLHMRARWRRYGPLLAPLDLVMARKQLLTLSELARRAP